MKEKRLAYLEALLNAPSPSGYEDKAREVWRAEMKECTDEVRGDTHGNSIATVNGEGAPRVMLAGHIDEIGFQVCYISDEGFISFKTIGGFDVQIIPGRRVIIHTENGPVKGVIGKKPIHLLEEDERKKPPKIHDLWIDTGMKDGDAVKEKVEIGDPVTYAVGFEHLADDTYVARGVDDRIGAFVVGEVARYVAKKREKLKASVFSVATVQEEVGLRGARTSAYGVNPDVGFAVDVTFANIPGSNQKKEGTVELGKGPVLSRGPNFNPKLFSLVKKIAKKKEIPLQIEAAPRGTGTDANAIQLTRAGVATALVSIPNRYMHTPVETFNIKDVENAITLIGETILALDGEEDFIV